MCGQWEKDARQVEFSATCPCPTGQAGNEVNVKLRQIRPFTCCLERSQCWMRPCTLCLVMSDESIYSLLGKVSVTWDHLLIPQKDNVAKEGCFTYFFRDPSLSSCKNHSVRWDPLLSSCKSHSVRWNLSLSSCKHHSARRDLLHIV